jgi:para-nitrobenzyl esterase
MLTDLEVRCPTRALARQASAAGSDVYLYNFEADRAIHGDDVQLLFAGGDTNATTLSDPASDSLASAMRHYWTHFAQYGDPNMPDAPTWPRYTSADDRYMRLESPPEAGSELAKDDCDFWEEVARQNGDWISSRAPANAGTAR